MRSLHDTRGWYDTLRYALDDEYQNVSLRYVGLVWLLYPKPSIYKKPKRSYVLCKWRQYNVQTNALVKTIGHRMLILPRTNLTTGPKRCPYKVHRWWYTTCDLQSSDCSYRSCGSRQALSNEPRITKIGVNTAKYGPGETGSKLLHPCEVDEESQSRLRVVCLNLIEAHHVRLSEENSKPHYNT